MAVYEYTAKDAGGNKFTGICNDIDSVSMLRNELAKMGDTLLKVKRRKSEKVTHVRIPQDEVVTFAYKFAGMCSSGLPISRCLETLEEQAENRSFGQVLSDIRQSVARGSNLKNAFAKHRNIFSDFFIGMIEAGESGGKLSESFEMIANYLDKQAELKRKLKAAFAYPIIVSIMCFIVVSCLVIFVVPVFSKLYRQMRVPLPGPTQVLVTLSILFREWWWVFPLVIAAILLFSKEFSRNAFLQAKWDSFKLNMPMFAKLYRMIVASHFIRAFAMLASTGVSLIKALEVAGLVVRNSKIREVSYQLQQSITAGNPVASSFKKCAVFPPMIVQLAASGEEAGRLSEMLNKGADMLDRDANRTIKALIVKIEPVMTVIMGLIVGCVLLGVYLPMFDYMAHLE